MLRTLSSTTAAAVCLLAACGGSSESPVAVPTGAPATDVAPTEAPAPTEAATTLPPETTTTEPPGPVAAGSLEAVRDGVVRIVGTGTFADPFVGVQANVPGSGSGFIIDPSGLAVTNNHVVTGAALLEVYVGQDTEPRNAVVVGVSECSDLAVIDIAGDDHPFLDWYDGPATPGLSIFAAGFPLGDEEYTVLDGIVSKEDAAGETSWASVDAVIEHSADTLPGSSGGPIVTDDGRVIAVNYAGNEAGQSFAIGLDVARPVVDELLSGNDVESIGINGEALTDGEFGGIWVYSVKSGSPADAAGIRAGDLLLTMEGVSVGVDGTMSAYCDILRSHAPTDVLAVEVYRSDTDELLEGQVNGRVLEAVTSFATEFDEIAADSGTSYAEYVTIFDDSGFIEVSVPVEWSDVLGLAWDSDLAPAELIGPALSASPDREAFINEWGTPGLFIGASNQITMSVEETLDTFWFGESCAYDGRFDYDDGVYTGLYDIYSECGGVGSLFFQVVATPADGSFITSVQILAVTDADLEAADEVFATFLVSDLSTWAP